MKDIDITNLSKVVAERMKEQELTIYEVSKKSGVKYSTVKDFLDKGRVSRLDTVQAILRAVGYEFSEILAKDKIVVEVSEDDDADIRRYRRLNGFYRSFVKLFVRMCLTQQAKDEKRGINREAET